VNAVLFIAVFKFLIEIKFTTKLPEYQVYNRENIISDCLLLTSQKNIYEQKE